MEIWIRHIQVNRRLIWVDRHHGMRRHFYPSIRFSVSFSFIQNIQMALLSISVAGIFFFLLWSWNTMQTIWVRLTMHTSAIDGFPTEADGILWSIDSILFSYFSFSLSHLFCFTVDDGKSIPNNAQAKSKRIFSWNHR